MEERSDARLAGGGGLIVKGMRTTFLGAFLVVITAAAAMAQSPDLLDTTAARRQWFDRVVDLSRPEERVSSQVISSPGAVDVEVRIDEQLGNRYYTFIRYARPPVNLASPGTFIVRQRRSDGAIDQIKVFLQHDEDTFFRLRPRENRRTLELDLYLAGREFYRDVTVPISWERAVRAPVSEIQRLTAGIIDWQIAQPEFDRPEYRAIAQVVAQVRATLPQLADAEDGSLDADGVPVFIDSLAPMQTDPGFNCSGFAKWVVDGFYQPRMGSLMAIDALREKHLDHRGTRWSRRLEETRDPYFGLDWTRNLAREVQAARLGVAPEELDPEARDVRTIPSARYREDVGFPIDDLSGIIYWLTVDEPGTIYLGSVNRASGEEAVLRQHSHVVVILPYFDDTGRFRPVVMERNVETGVAQLIRRFEGAFIHLVRIDGTQPFVPPSPPR